MKAISLWQPWASLIAVGAKRIETRSWPTRHRGLLAIHASKRAIDEVGLHLLMSVTSPLKAVLATSRTQGLPLGAIVATCVLRDCVQVLHAPPIKTEVRAIVARGTEGRVTVGSIVLPPPEPERSFGDYGEGRWCWLLDTIRKLDRPVPYRGAQGLFDVPEELLAATSTEVTR